MRNVLSIETQKKENILHVNVWWTWFTMWIFTLSLVSSKHWSKPNLWRSISWGHIRVRFLLSIKVLIWNFVSRRLKNQPLHCFDLFYQEPILCNLYKCYTTASVGQILFTASWFCNKIIYKLGFNSFYVYCRCFLSPWRKHTHWNWLVA